jgi:RNA polymerase sigma factor (sigma-70 family)
VEPILKARSLEQNARSPLTDAQAMREIAAGRVSALAIIYDRYHACLYRFFSNATSYAADVDDLVQTTFLSAAKAASSFDGRESCRPWLLAIAAGTLFRRRRTLARWGRTLRDFALSQSDLHTATERRILAKDELNDVARALSTLSEKKRVVLLLAELEEMPCEEIARALDIPVGTVWTRLHHARRELQAQFEREPSR